MKLFKLHRLVAPGTLAVVGLLLVLVPVANAAGSTFTWKGDAKAPGWSAAENWEGGIAPSAGSGPVALVFPWLTGIEGGDCGSSKPTEACYLGLDDVPGLTAESIQIDDGVTTRSLGAVRAHARRRWPLGLPGCVEHRVHERRAESADRTGRVADLERVGADESGAGAALEQHAASGRGSERRRFGADREAGRWRGFLCGCSGRGRAAEHRRGTGGRVDDLQRHLQPRRRRGFELRGR